MEIKEIRKIDLKEFVRKIQEEKKTKPCRFGKEGQVLLWLNCPYCQYAHYRFGWP